MQEELKKVNPAEYIKIVLREKCLIGVIVGSIVIGVAIVSLLMEPVYEATAVISPVQRAVDPSGIGTVAAQFGIISPGRSGVASDIVNLLRSNVLMDNVVKKYNLLPVFYKKSALTNLKGKTEDQKSWAGIRFMKKSLNVRPNQRDPSIVVSFTNKDPMVAANVLNYTLNELTDYMSSEARRVSQTNQKYLEAQVDKTADPFIKSKIYALIAMQIENSMMTEAKENFIFKVIDPPKPPDERKSPKRRQMVMISFIISLFLAIFVVIGKEYVMNHRNELSELGKAIGMGKLNKRVKKIKRKNRIDVGLQK